MNISKFNFNGNYTVCYHRNFLRVISLSPLFDPSIFSVLFVSFLFLMLIAPIVHFLLLVNSVLMIMFTTLHGVTIKCHQAENSINAIIKILSVPRRVVPNIVWRYRKIRKEDLFCYRNFFKNIQTYSSDKLKNSQKSMHHMAFGVVINSKSVSRIIKSLGDIPMLFSNVQYIDCW